MFDDLDDKLKYNGRGVQFPVNYEGWSVDELETYKKALQDEIQKVEADIARKKDQKAIADSFFKS